MIPPTIQQLLQVDHQEQEKMKEMKMEVSDVVKEKGSTFMGCAKKTKSLTEIRRAYKRVRLLHPEADHIVAAYNTKFHQGGHDDMGHPSAYKVLCKQGCHQQVL